MGRDAFAGAEVSVVIEDGEVTIAREGEWSQRSDTTANEPTSAVAAGPVAVVTDSSPDADSGFSVRHRDALTNLARATNAIEEAGNAGQWYLNNTGAGLDLNVAEVWRDYTGRGVTGRVDIRTSMAITGRTSRFPATTRPPTAPA